MKIKEQYVVDQNGRKRAIILDIASYRALLKRLEELEDALHLDEADRSAKGFPLYSEIRRSNFTFVGAGASGAKDISVRHDEALAEDFA